MVNAYSYKAGTTPIDSLDGEPYAEKFARTVREGGHSPLPEHQLSGVDIVLDNVGLIKERRGPYLTMFPAVNSPPPPPATSLMKKTDR